MTLTLTHEDLLNFNGCDQPYFHEQIKAFQYTEGVRHVAQAGGAYWLLVQISYAQLYLGVSKEEFQVWRLTVNEDRSARLTCTDGGKDIDNHGDISEKTVYSKDIPYTDFPLSEITFYLEWDMLMLPRER